MGIEISKKPIRGDVKNDTISLRLPQEMVEKLDDLSKEANRSRNEIAYILLNYALKEEITITEDN